MPKSRRISGLLWARPCARPSLPRSRPRGSKAAGLAYERKLAKAICADFPLAFHGQWYEYQDAAGLGHCQPDVVIPQDHFVVVVEVKLSAQEEAYSQARLLYKPILEHVYRRPCFCIVATKFLRRERAGDQIAASLGEALDLATVLNLTPLWHWIGSGPL